MIRLPILTLAVILSCKLFGQDANRFKNFHGIKPANSNIHFFEAEGYEIFIEQINYRLDEKGLKKIEKKYSIKGGQSLLDSVLNLRVLTSSEVRNGTIAYFNYYLIPDTDKRSTVVGFIRPKTRDVSLERDFVKSHLTNSIPPGVFTSLDLDSIDFVGRTIKLGPNCKWMSPHNVQCPDYGQMNWAIFDNLKQAEDYRDTYFEMTKNKNLIVVKEEKWLTLKFEGQETKALRTKVKVQVPKFAMRGSNILVVYYVAGLVRGKHVTCVLSHYTDDVDGDKLAPLLAEVLTLQYPDGTWPDDVVSQEIESDAKADSVIEENEVKNNDRGFLKIEAGIWIPVGNFSSKVGVSPNFGIHLPFINRPDRNFRIDCIVSLFIPQNTKEFTYTATDTAFTTKMGAPAGVFGLLFTKTKPIANSRLIHYFDQTAGLGIGIYPTTTDGPKKDPEDNVRNYHFDTIHLSYGVVVRRKIFRHKSIGIAVRYNFTPTSWFDPHVGSGFGSSSITTSLQLKI